MVKTGIIVLFVILSAVLVSHREIDNRYARPIIGDAKGYYAYLPAIFIYSDLTFSFVDELEQEYYAEDGSLAKNFLIEQPNGTFVNKCFPGTALFYLPFFVLAIAASWIFAFPLDGYSLFFQWSIVAAHFFYFFLSLLILNRFLKRRKIGSGARIGALVLLTLGTNCYFYVVYDNSLAHIFGLCGFSFLLLLTQNLRDSRQIKYLGMIAAVLSLLIITRPTNAMMAPFLFLVYPPNLWYSDFAKSIRKRLIPWRWILISIGILLIPLLLWKAQTGNWLVYSYGEEKLNLLNPNLINFLFSYKQGWMLWTPVILPVLIFGIIYFFRFKTWKGSLFSGGILLIVYVFSSWWIWTFGKGMGQRTMIDFYPIMIYGLAGFLDSAIIKRNVLWLLFFPLVLLNMIQAYQFYRHVLVGGETTEEYYWNHFLQLRPDAPVIQVPDVWQLIDVQKDNQPQLLGPDNAFSRSIVMPAPSMENKYVVKAVLGGENRATNVSIVMADTNGVWYEARYPAIDIYPVPRAVEYLFEPNQKIDSPVRCYIWNGDSGDEVKIEALQISMYTTRKE